MFFYITLTRQCIVLILPCETYPSALHILCILLRQDVVSFHNVNYVFCAADELPAFTTPVLKGGCLSLTPYLRSKTAPAGNASLADNKTNLKRIPVPTSHCQYVYSDPWDGISMCFLQHQLPFIINFLLSSF